MQWRIFRIPRATLISILLAGLLLLLAGSFSRAYVAGRQGIAAGLLEGRVIFIDPGHGGPDPGSVGPRGTLEKDVVLATALILRDYLTDAGARVLMTRTGDNDLSGLTSGPLAERKRRDLYARVAKVNESDAEILISVHANAIGSPQWSGAQTFYHPKSPAASKHLAAAIQRELIHITGETDRSINHHIQQLLLTDTRLPAVTVEVGFLSNPREEALLSRRSYQERVAWAIFIGTARYFSGLEQPPPAGTVTRVPAAPPQASVYGPVQRRSPDEPRFDGAVRWSILRPSIPSRPGPGPSAQWPLGDPAPR